MPFPFKYSLTEREKKYKIICWGIIEIDKKIVMVQTAARAFHGKWGPPLGSLRTNEDITTALQRGVKEDTSLEAEVDALIGIYHWYCKEVDYGFLYLTFSMKNPKGEIKPHHKNILNATLMEPHEIFRMPSESLTHSEVKNIIKQYRRGEDYPLDIIQDL